MEAINTATMIVLTGSGQISGAMAVIRGEQVVGHMPPALASSKQGTGII